MVLRQTINLGNSIIGVSILAMPYCFKCCGIVLGILIIILSGFLNRATCHLLLKSATITRKRSYELIAYDVFGPKGKLIIELGVLGFLIGTCVAFFVVVGDLGPQIVADTFDVPNGPLLRAFVMTFLGMFVALPLGLLRRLDSLSSFSALSLVLYTLLITKLFSEASVNMITASERELKSKINWWNWSGVLTNLPIFAMALSCQTQLFEVFDYTLLNFEDYHSVGRLNKVVKRAISLCSLVYIAVGILGYIAFYEDDFRGNILAFLPPSFSSSLTKLGFVFTVVISLPICLFPCRTSLHSLLFRKGTGSLLNEPSATAVYMSDHDFRLLTVVLIVTTIGISVVVPRIEVVLGIIGSTIGALISFILPGIIFTSITTKNTTERLMARSVTYLGFFILIACSWSTIQEAQLFSPPNPIVADPQSLAKIPEHIAAPAQLPKVAEKLPQVPAVDNILPKPAEEHPMPKPDKPAVKPASPAAALPAVPQAPRVKIEQLDPAKIKRQEELLVRLENQQREHKKLIEQQKQLLAQMREHEQEHHVADQKPAVAANGAAVSPNEQHKAVIPENPAMAKEEHSAVIPEEPAAKQKPPAPDIVKPEPLPKVSAEQRVEKKVPKNESPLGSGQQLKQQEDRPVAVPQQQPAAKPAQVLAESKREPPLPGEPVPPAPKIAIANDGKFDGPPLKAAPMAEDKKETAKSKEEQKLPKRDTLAVAEDKRD